MQLPTFSLQNKINNRRANLHHFVSDLRFMVFVKLNINNVAEGKDLKNSVPCIIDFIYIYICYQL